MRETLLVFYTQRYIEYRTIVEQEIVKDETLDSITRWILARAMEGAWLYYSFTDKEVVAVDLSQHVVRKDDFTGDLLFYRMHTEEDKENKNDKEPRKGWQFDFAMPSRPKLNVLKL